MLAPTRELAADLNARARTDRLAGLTTKLSDQPPTQTVRRPEVGLADGNLASRR